MGTCLRVSILILVLGVSVVCGTIIEGFQSVPVIDRMDHNIPGGSEKVIFVNRTLFARDYSLLVQVTSGGPIDIVFQEQGGLYQRIVNSVISFTEQAHLPFRGTFELLIRNLNISLSIIRVTFTQHGLDQQQLIVGQVLFAIGFSAALACVAKDWMTRPPNHEEHHESSNSTQKREKGEGKPPKQQPL